MTAQPRPKPIYWPCCRHSDATSVCRYCGRSIAEARAVAAKYVFEQFTALERRMNIAEAALKERDRNAVSSANVPFMARFLADRTAKVCNVDKDDHWKQYGQDWIDDVTAMLAALSAQTKPGSET